MNIEDLFKQGPLEGILSGALRDTIIAHGPVTRQTIGSFAKRAAARFRGQLVDSFKNDAEKVPCTVHSEQILRLQKEVEELKKRVGRANSQERRWRKKCVDHDIPLDGEVSPSLDEYAGIIKLAFENLYGNDDRDYERFNNLFDPDTTAEVISVAKQIEGE